MKPTRLDGDYIRFEHVTGEQANLRPRDIVESRSRGNITGSTKDDGPGIIFQYTT